MKKSKNADGNISPSVKLTLELMMPQLPQDKANHVIYGLALFIVGLLIVGSPLAGMILCVVGAIAKELSDKWIIKGTPEVQDFLATVAGGLGGLSVWLLAIYR